LNNKNVAVVKKNYIKGNYYTNGDCYGGGIGMYRSTKLEIVNNIITENSATYGGALHSWDNSKPVIINNTIVNNTAAQAGGALYSEDPSTYTILINTIMWDNIVTQIGNEIDIKNGNVAVSYCDIKGGWAGSGNRNTQPRFLNEDTLFHLDILDTVCINHGIDSVKIGNIWYFAPQTDYDGGSRAFLLSPPDIGADETDVLPDGFESNNIFNTSCEFILNQNYPNPFNSETVIRYALPVTCYIDLSIYNILGQKVLTLVSEKQPAGSHSVEFDAYNLPSGIYYYKLTAGTYQQVRKMLLIK
jgi:hypothetical protein